jgi:superfamily II DNA or RNA helicase
VTKVPTLIDNRDENTVLKALLGLLPHTAKLDVATGTFEIGALLSLGASWHSIEAIRIVMGDETTRRTRQVLLESLTRQTDESLEQVKERDDTLTGLDAVKQALQTKQIQVRVYTRAKFHAKTYLMETKETQAFNIGLVGSSNFTEPGLIVNVELNLLTTDQLHLKALGEWFEQVWQETEEVHSELLKVIERHLRAFKPFEVWAKALYEYFAGKEKPATHWDENESVVYPLLSKYQQDGYRAALAIAERWGATLICDGVGLGKTFIGLMLLEYHIHQGDRVLLIVPKSARESVWESALNSYLRPRHPIACEENLKIHNHTDFGREGTIAKQRLDYYRDYYPVILIDEAHHFRTPSANRSKALRALCDGGAEKHLYLLTATPINNRLRDLYHLINYAARDRQDHFAPLGIYNLSRHFTEAEQQLEAMLQSGDGGADIQAAAQDADLLRTDQLLRAIVIQRSRAYVKESERDNSNAPLFPEREKPRVVAYSLKRVYAGLYDELKAAFDRVEPLLKLAVYNPEVFRKGERDNQLLNRDRQVIGLIRTLLLKRLESSYKAFEASLEDLLRKMSAFVAAHDPERWERWRITHESLWATVEQHQQERRAEDEPDAEEEEGDEFDDIKTAELDGRPEEYDLDGLLAKVEDDMTLLVMLLTNVYQHLSPATDDKLRQLITTLKTDPLLKEKKVVIFTEFRDTARYLWRQLRDVHRFADVEELDSTRKVNREGVIKRFAPYYNCTDAELPLYTKNQIRILISTDVLSEGLNLQDANLIVNYDLHWNPVRLMQRIGRVDRRLNPDIERRLGRDDSQPLKVYVYNFLPPDELEDLLGLFRTVTGKLLRISKTLGIEAPLLTPDEEFEALRLFNEKYEGQRNIEEELHLELERLRREHPALFDELMRFPRRVFSGKRGADVQSAARGLFCAYRFPSVRKPEPPLPVQQTLPFATGAPTTSKQEASTPAQESGELRWYFRVTETGEIWESNRLEEIANAIRSTPETHRVTVASAEELKAWRQEIERGPVQRYLRDLQAPMGTKPTLVCWMEVC